jgi:hypothetical protein
MLEAYPHQADGLLERARFYAMDACCHEIAHGVEHGRREWVEIGLGGLRELFARS